MNPDEETTTIGWRQLLPVHPSADVFTSRPEKELDELAADIEASGLREAVKLWRSADGRTYLVHGRRRLDAMQSRGLLSLSVTEDGLVDLKIAGEPAATYLPSSDDPGRHVVSANLHRRDELGEAQWARLAVLALMAANEFENRPTNARSVRDKKALAATVANAAKVSKPTALEQIEVARDRELSAKVESGELPAEAAGKVARERKRAGRAPARAPQPGDAAATSGRESPGASTDVVELLLQLRDLLLDPQTRIKRDHAKAVDLAAEVLDRLKAWQFGA